MKIFTAFLLLLFSCSSPTTTTKPPLTTTLSGSAMTMPYKLIIGKNLSAEEEAEVTLLLTAVFEETNRIYNKYNPHSELSTLNALEANTKVLLSPKLERLLAETEELVLLTDGKFDPTVEPLQRLWREALEQEELPDEEKVKEILPAIGWHNIHIEDGKFWKENSATELDLGGIAKGLCVDEMIRALKQNGYTSLFFEWGGEIATHGRHPEGRPWKIFISSLGSRNPDESIATLSIENEGLATSGDYKQKWIPADGVTYTHIIDPTNQRPLISTPQSIASVSILAPNCETADAIATAAMLFPTADEARKWAKGLQAKIPHLEAWVVTREELVDDDS